MTSYRKSSKWRTFKRTQDRAGSLEPLYSYIESLEERLEALEKLIAAYEKKGGDKSEQVPG